MIAASRHTPAVEEIFAGIFNRAQSHEPRTVWNLRTDDAPVTACIEEGWLVMSTPAPRDATAEAMLGKNSALPGMLKLTLSKSGTPELCVEIPLDDDESGPLVREAWSGFESLRGENVPGLDSADAPVASQADLLRLCSEAEWPATARGEDACAVELECPGTFIQATLAAHGGGVRAGVQFGGVAESARDCMNATAILLLTTCCAVRMVRPAWEPGEGCVKPGLEVVFSTVPSAAQLAHALSGLSVACQCCAEEARALLDPDVAGEFLALSKTNTGNQHT